MPQEGREARSVPELSDQELDRYIRTRLALAGVDLSVLPEDDPTAPADQVRVLRSARRFLRDRAPRIAALDLDPDTYPPVMYPASLPTVEEGAPRTSGDSGAGFR